MGILTLSFRDIEVEKHNFHRYKSPILKDVDI